MADVALQCPNGRFVYRQDSGLAKLSAANSQEARIDIKIAYVETVSLADAKPGRVQESDQRGRCSGTQPVDRSQAARRGEYALKLLQR
jgi:hypothetical protein